MQTKETLRQVRDQHLKRANITRGCQDQRTDATKYTTHLLQLAAKCGDLVGLIGERGVDAVVNSELIFDRTLEAAHRVSWALRCVISASNLSFARRLVCLCLPQRRQCAAICAPLVAGVARQVRRSLACQDETRSS